MAIGTTVAKINAVVTANTTQFTGAMTAAEKKAQSFTSKAGLLAKKVSGPLALGFIGAAAASVAAGTEFEASMKKIESLVGLSTEAVDGMTDSVKALAGETGRGPKELADAMFFITSAGLRGQVALETLEASAKAAAVGLGDTATIADLATSALNAYGSDVLSAADATDVMVAAVREGKLEADALTGSMGRVLPVSSQMGIKFNEVGAAFAAMSRTGTGANEAATQLRSIMVTLLKPTKQAEEALAEMGLSSEGLRTQMREKGLLSTLQTLKEKFDGNSAATAEVFGNVRALVGVFDLMGANVETTEEIFASMADTTGTLDKAFEVTADTAAFKFQTAMADAQLILVNLGEAILPIAITMVDGIRTLVDGFAAMPGPLKLAAGAMATFVIASGPIGQIALAVGGLLYFVGKLGDESRDAKARQADLTAEFIAAGDPSMIMIDRMTEVAAAIRDTGDAAEEVINPIGELVGSTTAYELAAKRGLLPVLDELNLSLDDVTAAASGSTEEFARAMDGMSRAENQTDGLRLAQENLTGVQRELADVALVALVGGMDADEIGLLTSVVVDLSKAFGDQAAELETDAQAFIESASSAELLNAAGKDGVGMLTDWAAAGMSYTKQAERIYSITQHMGDAMEVLSPGAERAGVTITEVGDAAADAAGPIEDITVSSHGFSGAIAGVSAEAKTLQEAFEDLMGTIVFEGEALNNTQLLLADMDAVLEEMAEQTLPEMRDSFYDMAQTSAGQLGELVDAGLELGGPEMTGAAQSMIDKLALMGDEAGIPFAELVEMQRLLLEMSGMDVPITIRVATEMLPSVFNAVKTGTGHVGASGGIVTQPTMALIGEAGPEAVVPLSSAPGASVLPGGMSGGTSYTITVNTGIGDAGQIGAGVVDAITAYERRNGTSWRAS
tara:strand:+ start:1014 stop:3725 length:2712 start_codon:yes stop_codon:yes gene_type:complete